jgi:energy-coupling factor transport system permease protein
LESLVIVKMYVLVNSLDELFFRVKSLQSKGSLIFKSILLAILVMAWGKGRLPWRLFAVTLLSMILLFLSTVIYHVLLADEGSGYGTKGIASGFAMCLQIAGLMVLLALLVHTTAPWRWPKGWSGCWRRSLAGGRRSTKPCSCSPLSCNSFRSFSWSSILSARKAQMARGGGFHWGGVVQRLRGVLPILMPMVVRSIVRTEELATAMESRCNNGGAVEHRCATICGAGVIHFCWQVQSTWLRCPPPT